MTVREIGAWVAGSIWLRLAGAACVVAIAVLTLVPKEMKAVDTAVVSGPVQHFVAYFAAAVVIGLGARRRINPLVLVAALAVYSGVLEVLQNLAPGRDPAVEGVVWSGLGAVAGAALAFGIRDG